MSRPSQLTRPLGMVPAPRQTSGGRPRDPGGVLSRVPIRPPDDDPGLRAIRDELVNSVDAMLHGQQQKRDLAGHELTLVERRLATPETRIDQLVYEIYGLDSKTIDEIEAATALEEPT